MLTAQNDESTSQDVVISHEESVLAQSKPNHDSPAQPQMHDIGIQCCFDPICYKIVETQTDEKNNASTNVSEKTSNKLSLPDQDGAHVSVEADESKVKLDRSYATQPPPYVIFPTYEDDSFNATSPPPLYEVEVVLRTNTEEDEIVFGNENGDDSGDNNNNNNKDLYSAKSVKSKVLFTIKKI